MYFNNLIFLIPAVKHLLKVCAMMHILSSFLSELKFSQVLSIYCEVIEKEAPLAVGAFTSRGGYFKSRSYENMQ